MQNFDNLCALLENTFYRFNFQCSDKLKKLFKVYRWCQKCFDRNRLCLELLESILIAIRAIERNSQQRTE